MRNPEAPTHCNRKASAHIARVGTRSSVTTAKDGSYSWITALAFAFLTYSSATAAYRSRHDPPAVAFIAASYADLLLLLLCLRALDEPPASAGGGGPRRGRLKAAVWALATLLTLMFSYRVAAVMPWPVAAAIWTAASAVTLGGFWALFVYKEAAPDGIVVDSKP